MKREHEDRTTATPADATVPASSAFLATLVGLAFLMNMVGRGVTETFAVFLLPVQGELGVTRPAMTATYSVYMLCYALAAPLAGQLIDRLGARATYAAGLAALGLGYAAAGSVTEVWHYYLAVGLCGGIGAAMLGMVAASSLMSRWFTRRIGSVMSLPYAAIGAGMLILPPLTQLLIERYGWRAAHRMLGLGTLALLPVVLALPLARMTEGAPEWRAARSHAKSASAGPWPLRAAVRTGAFWGLFSAYFWTSVAAYSVLPQSVAYLVEQGFQPIVAASAFGMTGALSVIGIIAVGWISDRLGRRQTVTVTFLVTIAGIGCLLAIALWPGVALLYGFVLLFGLMQGVRGPIILALITVLYPGGAVGSIFGTLSIALGLGAGAGSLVSGLLKQTTGTYTASFLVAVIACVIGMSMFWLVPSLRNERIPPGTSGEGGARPS